MLLCVKPRKAVVRKKKPKLGVGSVPIAYTRGWKRFPFEGTRWEKELETTIDGNNWEEQTKQCKVVHSRGPDVVDQWAHSKWLHTRIQTYTHTQTPRGTHQRAWIRLIRKHWPTSIALTILAKMAWDCCCNRFYSVPPPRHHHNHHAIFSAIDSWYVRPRGTT